MPGPDPQLLSLMLDRIAKALPGHDGLLVVGICGAQGSGKSTLCTALESSLGQAGIAAATLSLDDLYLARAERQNLARDVHPLFATRGVPGTHDVELGLETITALERGSPIPLPRFDKGRDDRAPMADWPRAPRTCRVLLFEGWCVGAMPQADAQLDAPVNRLESDEDPAAVWRRHANAALGGPYRQLFARIDLLVLLAAPGWRVVARWRDEQEDALRRAQASHAMSPARLQRFIQHYQRLTDWILSEMPGRADLTVALGEQREVHTMRPSN